MCMAAEAKEEGFNQVAALFTMVAAIEKDHEERYKALAANIEAGKVYALSLIHISEPG